MADDLREINVTEANSQVAHAIREELCRLGLVSAGRADALEHALQGGTVNAEDWFMAIESSLLAKEGAADVVKQPE
jgi:hypothetical protein